MKTDKTYGYETTFHCSYMSPEFIDFINGVTYKRADLTIWQKIKIFFGLMQEPKKIRVEPTSLMDLIPKTKLTGRTWKATKEEIKTHHEDEYMAGVL